MFWRKPKPKPKPETAGEREERIRNSLKRNPVTGQLLITRRSGYIEAVIDDIMEVSCRAK